VWKALAIARTSWREVIRRPAIWIVTGFTLVMIVLFRFFTLFALGQERSMIREMALASITLAGLLVAVLGASTVLAEEEEKRTLLTLLSKPVGRGQIIVGKFFGIAAAVLLVFVPLVLVYVGAVCWSEIQRPRAGTPAVAQQVARFLFSEQPWSLVKASALAYAGVMVLAAVSIAFSTRLPMIMNIVLTLGVFALGHQAESILALLYPTGPAPAGIGQVRLIDQVELRGLVATIRERPQIAIGKVVYGLIPGIEAFNAGQAVAMKQAIPLRYVAAAFGYAILYIAFALLIAQLLFRHREFS